MDIRSLLGKQLLFFDGGMGSLLQEKGLQPGALPELMNLTDPQTIRQIHTQYYQAGSHVVTANTFGANRLKLRRRWTPLRRLPEQARERAQILRLLKL